MPPRAAATPLQREEARLKVEAQKRKEAKDAANALALRLKPGRATVGTARDSTSAPADPPPPDFDQVRKALHDHKHAEAAKPPG